MASNDPGAWSQDWRQDAKGSDKPVVQYDWQAEGNAQPKKKSRRWAKIIGGVALASIVCVIGYLIYMIAVYKPIRVVLAGAGYEPNLVVEHNARGWESLGKLKEQLLGTSVSSSWLHSGEIHVDGPRRLGDRADWNELKDELRSFKGGTLVLVLALHGGVDKNGSAYFFLDKVTYPGANTLGLEEVLDALKEVKAKNKVLILEPAQMTAHWSSGMLANDFVGELKKLEDRILKENLVVLCASDVSQRSWPSAQSGLTVFTDFLTKGLQGAADEKKEGGNGNGRVTALELATYVQKNVPIWVKAAHNKTAQTPLLLPTGREGQKRAEGIELALVKEADSRAPAEGALSADTLNTIRKEVEKGWGEWQDLRDKHVPSPAVYSPHLWRRYQDTLLRYEQLLLAGSKEAKTVKDLKDKLKGQLDAAPEKDWRSAQSTLAMPAALGLASDRSDPDLSKEFEDLWKTFKPGQSDRLQAWLEQYLPRQDTPEQYAKLAGLALNKIIDDPDKKNLTHPLLEEIKRPFDQKPPAEFHFLSMYVHLYEKGLPGTLDQPKALEQPKPALLRHALRVRRQAEEVALAASPASGEDAPTRVHPYSEQVFPWIQKLVEAADQERRLGEDLLFASSSYREDERDGAEIHLKNAEKGYQHAESIAVEVRGALALRDRAMAEYPYYAQWLLRRPPEEVSDPSFERVQRLAEATHALAQFLAQPTPLPGEVPPTDLLDGAQLKKLQELSKEINGRLSALEAEKDQVVRSVGQRVQTDWDEIQALLSVPLVKPDERRDLLGKLWQVAARLEEAAKEAAKETTAAKEDGQAEARAQQRARRQEAMAWAALGKRPRQPREAGRARSDQIAFEFQALPGRIDKLTDEAGTMKVNEAIKGLREADLSAHLLDGAAAETLRLDPCLEHRHANLYQLLVWQAHRAFKDHWWGQIQKARPYYELACQAYLADAKSVAVSRGRKLDEDQLSTRLSQIKEVEDLLAHAKELAFTDPPKQLDMTSDPKIRVRHPLEVSEALLPAYPVLWRTVDRRHLSLEGSQVDDRLPIRDFGDQKPVTRFVDSFEVRNDDLAKDEENPPPSPYKNFTKVALHVLYRGHIIANTPNLTIHHGADITVLHHPEPSYGSLAIRTDEKTLEKFALSEGALDIVIDYSGSMGYGQPKGNRKIDRALGALEDVLRDLPEGVRLGVWVFGDKDVLDNTPKKDWVRQIREPKPWRRAELVGLMTSLDLGPRSFTPLVRAMTLAARRDFERIAGPKILLVLTDGMDTRFVKQDTDVGAGQTNHTEGDPDLNKGSKGNPDEIPDFLKNEFGEKDITINMVLFDPPAGEKDLAHRQFKVIEMFHEPGKIYDARDVNELRQKLKLSLVQQLWCKIRRGGKLVGPREGLKIMRYEDTPIWFGVPLDADQYTGDTRNLRPQQIQFENGDFIEATLTGNGLERTLVGRRASRDRQQRSRDWLLAVMQDQLRNDQLRVNNLQMLVTIEKQPGPEEEGILKQVKPRFTWFELTPQERKDPISLWWQNLARYPAYAVSLDVPKWPSRPEGSHARPELHAWWTREKPKAHAAVPLADVLETSVGPPPSVRLGREESVTVENVRFVSRKAKSSADDEKPMSQPCLIVRIRHAEGRPVLARLRGARGEIHQEDQFYKQAHSYTGIFWPVQESEKSNLTLELISLEELKKDKGTEHATLDQLDEPNPRETRDRHVRQCPNLRPS